MKRNSGSLAEKFLSAKKIKIKHASFPHLILLIDILQPLNKLYRSITPNWISLSTCRSFGSENPSVSVHAINLVLFWNGSRLCHLALTSFCLLSDTVKNFMGNQTHQDHFKLLQSDGVSLLIGARNVVYNLSLSDLSENVQQVSNINSNRECSNIGHSFVCGRNTNAWPTGWRDILIIIGLGSRY